MSNQAKGLSDHGSEFEELYIKYENDPKYIIKKIKATDLGKIIAQTRNRNSIYFV